MELKHTLYGAEISYFSGKARSYLRWREIGFEEKSPDLKFYQEVCVPRIGYPMIPLLITPENVAIQDTTLIFDHFENLADQTSTFIPDTPKQKVVAHLLELFADNWLLIPAMHYRWEYDADATMMEFGMNLCPEASKAEQKKVGYERAQFFKGAVSLLGVHSTNMLHVEEWWKELLSELDCHFREHQFLLGDRPCAGDFGLVGALYAHMYRDATAGSLMRKEGLAVARYVERMMNPNQVNYQSYLDTDEIPETLLPILRRITAEQLPCVVDTIDKLVEWRKENPDELPPRTIGYHTFKFHGVCEQRAIFPYSVWMLHRIQDSYSALEEKESKDVDDLLASLGGVAIRDIQCPFRLKMENYKLVWSE